MARKIWMSVNRLYCPKETVSETQLQCFEVKEGESVKQTTASLKRLLGLDDDFVLQLRNSRGSFILLNGKLQGNTKDTPYFLNIVYEHQTVDPKARSVKLNSYTTTIFTQIRSIVQRISRLEDNIPDLKVKRQEKIRQEIESIEQKLSFLRRRFNEADQTAWTGIIRKSPLW